MKTCAWLALLILWVPLFPAKAAPVILSDLLAGGAPLNGRIIQGNLQFDNFFYTVGSVLSSSIAVTGFTSATGDFGLQFVASPPLQISPGGGGKDFIFNLSFNVTVLDTAFINGFRQSFDIAGLSGPTIIALDSTVVGLVGASNCVVPAGSTLCANTPHTDAATLAPTRSLVQLDRQVQLASDRKSSDTGIVTTWDIVFSELAPQDPTATPEPLTEVLMGGGLAALSWLSATRVRRTC